MAERVGFEPTVPVKVRRISSAVLSTTQPPLHLRGPSEGAETSGAAPLPQARCVAHMPLAFLKKKLLQCSGNHPWARAFFGRSSRRCASDWDGGDMVETGRDRLARDGSRREGVDHVGRGRRSLFTRELKVVVSLNKDLRFDHSHVVSSAAGFRPDHSSIGSRRASGAASNGRFRWGLCLPGLAKADETIDDFLVERRFRVEIGEVLPYGNALS
jgi:hypothetical protein